MKIRQGFVSNSSSSSFCIIGVKLEDEAIETIKNILDITNEDIFAKMAEKSTTETVEEFCEDWLENILEDCGFDVEYIEAIGYFVIGNDIGSDNCEEWNAQEEFDKAKKILEENNFPSDKMKIFTGMSYC